MSRLSIVVATTVAVLSWTTARSEAQPYGSPPGAPPPAYGAPAPAYAPAYVAPVSLRRGLTLGVGLGIGGMESADGPIECVDCKDSAAGSFDLHVGVMLNPRFALMFEMWGTAQALDSQADVTLVQVLALGAAQYWMTPRVWIKGGVGSAHLSERYADIDQPNDLDSGVGVMAAVGAELISRPRFALDVQLRAGSGTYEGLQETITQASLQLGLSWF